MWILKLCNRWWYSVVMMAAYVSLFVYWKLMPARVTFVAGALIVACGLGVAMAVALRRGYFAGWVDVVLHGLVIVDIFLEGFAFEIVLPWLDAPGEAPQLAARYHDSNGFLLCSLLFAMVLFTGHFFGLRRRDASALSPAADDSSRQDTESPDGDRVCPTPDA